MKTSKPSEITADIVISVMNGIVNDVYIRRPSSAMSVQVLDVDNDRPDAEAVRAEWSRVATNPHYTRLDHKFYAPLDE